MEWNYQSQREGRRGRHENELKWEGKLKREGERKKVKLRIVGIFG